MDEFATYSKTYKQTVDDSIKFSGLDINFFTRVKADFISSIIKNNHSAKSLEILDLGCGVGTTDKVIKEKHSNLSGCDISLESIKVAKELNPSVAYSHYSGDLLPYNQNQFDFIFTINVMHHVPPEMWATFVSEAHRVLKPNGTFVVFEHNPLNPLTQKAVNDCPFDKDAVLLSMRRLKRILKSCGLKTYQSRYIIFFPFKHKIFRYFEKFLYYIPLGAQYYIASTKPKESK